MIKVPHLQNEPLSFPPTRQALSDPNGLLAVGGDLTEKRLLYAYERGIFPWYDRRGPILWWTPDPRSVLFPDELHVSRSMKKLVRQRRYEVVFDKDFSKVIDLCASVGHRSEETWIDKKMRTAYTRLHDAGIAHSVSVYDLQGQLLAGLYGIALGKIFFGESMFTLRPNLSKLAFISLVTILIKNKFELIDCQIETNHLNSLGARNITRSEFEAHLKRYVKSENPHEKLHFRIDQSEFN